jgi:arylsulfatase
VIIVVDAFRTKNTSLHGYSRETDKNIKRIASKGIWFKNLYSSSNSTAPSVTSIFTGDYPPKHGILHQLPYTKPEEFENVEKIGFWLPTFLQSHGYETIAIDWIGLWFEKGFNYYGEGELSGQGSAPFRPAREITDLALGKISGTEKPFFLFLHYWDTHFPFPTIEHTDSGVIADMDKTLELVKNDAQRNYLKARISKSGPYTFEAMKEKYDRSIEVVDEQVGRVYDSLRESGQLDDTAIFILGDHGMNTDEHGIHYSSSGLYEDSIRAPFVAHLPGFSGKEIEHFVQNVDIVPTVLDFLGLDSGKEFDGKSLIPMLENGEPVRDKVISYDGLCEDIKAVRTLDRKLVIAKNNFCNLCKSRHHSEMEEFDMVNDLGEMENVYSGESSLSKFLE